jgi:hypothetical protein
VRGLSRVAALALAAGVAAGGCGGDDRAPESSTKDSAKESAQQVADYLAAFGRGDGASACALLTPQAAAGVRSLSDEIDAPDCEGAIAELARIAERIRAPRISVSVNGERAVAKVTSKRPPYRTEVLLTKQDGEWRLAVPPAILQRYSTPPGIPDETGAHGRR